VWGKGTIVNLAGGRTIAPTCDEKKSKMCIGKLLKFHTKNISFTLVKKKGVVFWKKRAPPL